MPRRPPRAQYASTACPDCGKTVLVIALSEVAAEVFGRPSVLCDMGRITVRVDDDSLDVVCIDVHGDIAIGSYWAAPTLDRGTYVTANRVHSDRCTGARR